MSYEDTREGYSKFLQDYRSTQEEALTDDSDIRIPYSFDSIKEEQIKGELIDWTWQYLKERRCPDGLKYHLAVIVPKEMLKDGTDKFIDVSPYHDKPKNIDYKLYDSLVMLRALMIVIHDILCKFADDGVPEYIQPYQPPVPSYSDYAIRNNRRKMEDRHVVIPNLNHLLDLPEDHPPTQFYAVYDGHGGVDAAEFAAKHFHVFLINQEEYKTDLSLALKKCVKMIDEKFTEFANKLRLRSGTTAVIVVIRDGVVYNCWIGDSQVEIIRNGRALETMKPHKPNDPDEKKRVEDLGGCVVWFGAWRVNGQLAVSRAIGDIECKPFVSNDADCSSLKLEGNEDLVCLACDGFWDVFTREQLMGLVNEHMEKSNGNKKSLAEFLCNKARDNGSGDNISVIVVFLHDEFVFHDLKQQEKEEVPVSDEKDEEMEEGNSPDQAGESPPQTGESPDSSTNEPKEEGFVVGTKFQPEERYQPPHKLLRNYGNVKKSKTKSFVVRESNPHAKMTNSVVSYKLRRRPFKQQPTRNMSTESLMSLMAVDHDHDNGVLSEWGNPLSTIGKQGATKFPPIREAKTSITSSTLNGSRRHSTKKNSASIVMTNNPFIPSAGEVELKYWSKQYSNQRVNKMVWNSHKVPSQTKTLINNSFYTTLKPKSMTLKPKTSYATMVYDSNKRNSVLRKRRSRSAL